MLKNYIIIAFRNLWKNKLITGINLLGMTLGFSIFLSFWSMVQYDLKFDTFHDDIDQIYNLNVRINMNGSEYTSERTAGIYYNLLPENFPQISSSCRISDPLEFEFGIEGDSTLEEAEMIYYSVDKVLSVDSTFLSFFSFKLKQGSQKFAIPDRNHIVLTESLAKRIFGDDDPVGRSLKIGEGGYFVVAAVLEDPPSQSSIQFEALVGFHIMEELGYPINGYDGTMFLNFFKIRKNAKIPLLNDQINMLVGENFESDLEQHFFLDTFKRLHLHGENKKIISFYLNLLMAFVILAIACINFINLTTAYSLTRTKEIAIRKSLGASRRQLIIQFMGETFIILAVAFYLGLFVLEQLIPILSKTIGESPKPDFSSLSNIIKILVIFILTGFIAGLYPAYKIAGFKALPFLLGRKGDQGKGGSRSRKVLIVVQFTFSIVFIIIAIFVSRQYTYLKEADLGFNREDVLYISTNGKSWDKYELIKSELKKLHFVENVSTGSSIPTLIDRGEIDWGERDEDHNQLARILVTGENFTETFDIEMLDGEYFSSDRDSVNNTYVVVNKGLVDLMGWESDVIGQKFYLWGRDFSILGVTENINFFPFNLKVFGNEALIYTYEEVREFIFVRVKPGTSKKEIAMVEDVFNKHNPGYVFDCDFVKNYKIEAQQSEEAVKMIFKPFAGLAIFIAIMGLIGLSVYNNNRRTKEVGVRKVHGAEGASIFWLLISEFSRLLIISNIIALPLAYLILRKSFSIFSYSVDLKLSVFLFVCIASIAFTIVIVSYHTLRVSRSNPIDSLRYE